MNKAILFGVLMIITNAVLGQIIPNNAHQQVIDRAMNNYWGKARLKDGSYVKPTSEKERNAVLITSDNASEVIKIGELSSLADWCGLEWQSNYSNTTNGARSYGLSGKQVAFVGLLHGVAMGTVDQAVKGEVCSAEQKKSVKVRLNKISNKSINFAPSAPDTLTRAGY